MNKNFNQIVWNESLAVDVRALAKLAFAEDLDGCGDLTTQSLVPSEITGSVLMRTRQDGVVAGLAAIPTIMAMADQKLSWKSKIVDGDSVKAGDVLGQIDGPVSSILSVERIILNLVGKLSGIATLTKCYIIEVAGMNVGVYDTRKTTLGWRRLEKYAVHCGGGMNHRTGLYDAILIKDNHLAFGQSVFDNQADHQTAYNPAEAVRKAKQWLEEAVMSGVLGEHAELKKFKTCGIQVAARQTVPKKYKSCGIDVAVKQSLPIVEVEVDSLEQLAGVLPEFPDIVLLDNMTPNQLKQAVAMRDQAGVATELEASGGITLKTIRAVAETGVERISCGALTHSAISLDIGLDF